MSEIVFSDAFYLAVAGGDKLWPCTVAGHFRVVTRGPGHNVKGAGENDATEAEMINAVINDGKASRFRSKDLASRLGKQSRHRSLASRDVEAVYVNVGGTFVRRR